jgi:hypothetical protein
MPIFYHCLIIFPFPGLEKTGRGYQLFRRLLELCATSSGGSKPIVIYDKRSREPKATKQILSELENSAEIVKIWGVDTCQDWLAGWGYVLDKELHPPESNHRKGVKSALSS